MTDQIYYSSENIYDLISTENAVYISSANDAIITKFDENGSINYSVASMQSKLIELSSEGKIISYYMTAFSTVVEFPEESTSFVVPFVSLYVKYSENSNTLAFISPGGRLRIYKCSDLSLYREKDLNVIVVDFYNLGHACIISVENQKTIFYIPQFDHLNFTHLNGYTFIASNADTMLLVKNNRFYTYNIFREILKISYLYTNIIYRITELSGLVIIYDNKIMIKKYGESLMLTNFTYPLNSIAFFDIYNDSFYTIDGKTIVRHLFANQFIPGERIYVGDWWTNYKINNCTQSIIFWDSNKIQKRDFGEIYQIEMKVPAGIAKNSGINHFSVDTYIKRRNVLAEDKLIHYTSNNASPASSSVTCDGFNRMGFSNDNDVQDKYVTVKT